MRKVLSGDYGNAVGHVTVIDCRYPYEYQGGHILVSKKYILTEYT